MRRSLSPLAALLLSAAPAAAWEFRPDPVCTLSHDGPEATVVVTYDPRLPEYAITVTRKSGAWPAAPIFALRFDGPAGMTISTTRHVLSPDGAALTVTDRGFGNVLEGLEFNATATALAGGAAAVVDLAGAAPEVAAFRACAAAPTV